MLGAGLGLLLGAGVGLLLGAAMTGRRIVVGLRTISQAWAWGYYGLGLGAGVGLLLGAAIGF